MVDRERFVAKIRSATTSLGTALLTGEVELGGIASAREVDARPSDDSGH
jgi:hypothetical protein